MIRLIGGATRAISRPAQAAAAPNATNAKASASSGYRPGVSRLMLFTAAVGRRPTSWPATVPTPNWPRNSHSAARA